jgi:hypothetical protein
MQRYTVYFIWKLLYTFRVIPSPIISSANNCIYSIWYLSHRYCYLLLSWRVGTGLSVLWVAYATYSPHVYCPNLVKFDIRHLNVMLFIIYEIRENWRREDLTFVLGAHGVTFTLVWWIRLVFWRQGAPRTTARVPRICSYRKISCLDLYS